MRMQYYSNHVWVTIHVQGRSQDLREGGACPKLMNELPVGGLGALPQKFVMLNALRLILTQSG